MAIKDIKEIGWTHLGLSGKNFKGAVHEYENDKGQKVALGFNKTEAFYIEDSEGLFGTKDLKVGIINDADIDIDELGDIDGAYVVAFDNEEGEVIFSDEALNHLGLNDFSVKDSLAQRIRLLAQLNTFKTVGE